MSILELEELLRQSKRFEEWTLSQKKKAAEESYTSILKKAQAHLAEWERIDVEQSTVDRAIDMYGPRMWSGNEALTLELYIRVARLPSTISRTCLSNEHRLVHRLHVLPLADQVKTPEKSNMITFHLHLAAGRKSVAKEAEEVVPLIFCPKGIPRPFSTPLFLIVWTLYRDSLLGCKESAYKCPGLLTHHF